ncbi:hypothetical protein FE633_03150 [Streptomyces montanus]|uniref:Secreted protein n=1 Tax=Streptomyces montanus TaxID=2580423 RepID=A0A5R9G214_9ACTN|nr:hypothetical protein FE633_03150 [Streptomyces montanus]
MVTQNHGVRGLSAAAAVLALTAAGAVAALAAQRRALEGQFRDYADLLRRMETLEAERRRESRRAELIEYQRDHRNLLMKAIHDPSLLPVVDTYDRQLPPETQRQYLFANALYVHALHGYRIGVLTLPELRGHIRGIFQSTKVREYWDATRHHRASLQDGSEEAQIGAMVDELLQELDEAETDEWWVIGETPDE